MRNLIDSIEWKEEEIKIDEKIQNKYIDECYKELYNNKESFMDLINREYDENVFSNMLYYYFYKKRMIKAFANEFFCMEISDNVKIEREKNIGEGRIDIWIEDKDNKKCIVVENKLKSGINGRAISKDNKKQGEASQLKKYSDWVESKFDDYEKKYCIFVPNYKKEELKEDINKNKLMPPNAPYEIIAYKKIFEFFYRQKENMKSDRYYIDFLRALSKHIYTEEEMERKFVYAIKMCN